MLYCFNTNDLGFLLNVLSLILKQKKTTSEHLCELSLKYYTFLFLTHLLIAGFDDNPTRQK